MVALATAAALLFAPTGATQSCSASTAGPLTCTSGTTSMLATEGLWVLAPLSLPAVACLLPVVLRSPLAARMVAISLFAYCLLTGFTIGLFFVPVAVAAVVRIAVWCDMGVPFSSGRTGCGASGVPFVGGGVMLASRQTLASPVPRR